MVGVEILNYQNFLFENFQFLEVKVSIYLNRHVFVMVLGVLNVLFFFFVFFFQISAVYNVCGLEPFQLLSVENTDVYMSLKIFFLTLGDAFQRCPFRPTLFFGIEEFEARIRQ